MEIVDMVTSLKAILGMDIRLIATRLWRTAFTDDGCTRSDGGRFPNFDMCRFALAALVLIVHIRSRYGYLGPELPFNLYLVPNFIALSGFLIPLSYARSRGWYAFAIKRAARVMPGFLLSLCLTFALLGTIGVKSALMTYLTAGYVQYPLDANGAMWSLGVEEVLYTLLAIAFALRMFDRKWPVYAALGTASILAGFWLAPDIAHSHQIQSVIGCFLVGNTIYLQRAALQKIRPWLTVALLAFSTFLPASIITTYIQGFCLVLFAAYGPKVPWRIPDISYGLYILHYPILTALHDKVPPIIIGGVAIGVATLSWFLVERPAMQFMRRQVLETKPLLLPATPNAGELAVVQP